MPLSRNVGRIPSNIFSVGGAAGQVFVWSLSNPSSDAESANPLIKTINVDIVGSDQENFVWKGQGALEFEFDAAAHCDGYQVSLMIQVRLTIVIVLILCNVLMIKSEFR